MSRIAVVGCCGAGKSTFAQKLAKKTNLPLYHLDKIFWKPNWMQEDPEVFQQKLREWTEQEQWIIDGNFTRTASTRFQAADTVFFFDYPVWLCLFRTIKRVIISYGQTRSDMADGCSEHFDFAFLRYISRFRTETRPRVLQALEEYGQHCKVIVFKRPSDVKEWLENYKEKHVTD